MPTLGHVAAANFNPGETIEIDEESQAPSAPVPGTIHPSAMSYQGAAYEEAPHAVPNGSQYSMAIGYAAHQQQPQQYHVNGFPAPSQEMGQSPVGPQRVPVAAAFQDIPQNHHQQHYAVQTANGPAPHQGLGLGFPSDGNASLPPQYQQFSAPVLTNAPSMSQQPVQNMIMVPASANISHMQAPRQAHAHPHHQNSLPGSVAPSPMSTQRESPELITVGESARGVGEAPPPYASHTAELMKGTADNNDGCHPFKPSAFAPTRVDGNGLWRSWKRNFKTKLLALLDLLDNSFDASICGMGSREFDQLLDANHRVDPSGFVGRVHVYADEYKTKHTISSAKGGSTETTLSTTTGICIVNNCHRRVRPLDQVLEVFSSSKTNSGTDAIGENGVGLKQGCATMSDLSFVLVKNGSSEEIELGIIAASLQKTQGCYLPSFKFSNSPDSKLALKEQMTRVFSHPTNREVGHCIAQYGAARSGSPPNLSMGIDRLCKHFDSLCYYFHQCPYVFGVILDKVRHGKSDEPSLHGKRSLDHEQKIRVKEIMNELREKIPYTYLHVPHEFDFCIDGKDMEFKYWPERLVEMSVFKTKIATNIPWHQAMTMNDDQFSHYDLRVYVGFDGIRLVGEERGNEAALYVYSRRSGRLVKYEPDARTLLGLSAGGSRFCSGLTVVVDDIGGRLPLNPTKQDIAFGEEGRGEVHKLNLFKWIGAVTNFYYTYHIRKYNELKMKLTSKISSFAPSLKEVRNVKGCDESEFTNFNVSWKPYARKTIRVDWESVQEFSGPDTCFRLVAEQSANQSQVRSGATPSQRNVKRRLEESTSKQILEGQPMSHHGLIHTSPYFENSAQNTGSIRPSEALSTVIPQASQGELNNQIRTWNDHSIAQSYAPNPTENTRTSQSLSENVPRTSRGDSLGQISGANDCNVAFTTSQVTLRNSTLGADLVQSSNHQSRAALNSRNSTYGKTHSPEAKLGPERTLFEELGAVDLTHLDSSGDEVTDKKPSASPRNTSRNQKSITAVKSEEEPANTEDSIDYQKLCESLTGKLEEKNDLVRKLKSKLQEKSDKFKAAEGELCAVKDSYELLKDQSKSAVRDLRRKLKNATSSNLCSSCIFAQSIGELAD